MKILEQTTKRKPIVTPTDGGKTKRKPIVTPTDGGKTKRKPIVTPTDDGKTKRKPIVTPTDKTTIPSPQPNNVDQTSSLNLTPKYDPSYKIWLEFSEGDGETTHEKENGVFVFVKAIEKAYLSKNTKQDVY